MIGEILVATLLVISGVFGLIGSFGLLKLDDPMKRLHAPTKATTVGVGSALLASSAYFWTVQGRISWEELLVIIFLFISSPITAHFLAKAHMHRNMRPSDLPPTERGNEWATFQPDVPPGEVRTDGSPASTDPVPPQT